MATKKSGGAKTPKGHETGSGKFTPVDKTKPYTHASVIGSFKKTIRKGLQGK